MSVYGFPVSNSKEYFCDIFYNEGTRTLTLLPKEKTFTIFANTVEYEFSELTISHPNIYGNHFIYLNSFGQLVTSQTPWNIFQHAPICIVFYDGQLALAMNERHTSTRDLHWHRDLHQNRGTEAISGFSITRYNLDNPLNDAQYSYVVNSGIMRDEDIDTTSKRTLAYYYTIIHRQGTQWKITKNHNVPVLYGFDVIQYNKNTNGTWALENPSNNNWVNYWVIGVPSIPEENMTPRSSGSLFHLQIPGDREHFSLESALDEKAIEVDMTGLPFQEMVPLYKITYQYSTDYANLGNSARVKIVNVERLSGTAKAFTRLTDMEEHIRDANPHPQYSYVWEPVVVNNGSLDFLTVSDGDMIMANSGERYIG